MKEEKIKQKNCFGWVGVCNFFFFHNQLAKIAKIFNLKLKEKKFKFYLAIFLHNRVGCLLPKTICFLPFPYYIGLLR